MLSLMNCIWNGEEGNISKLPLNALEADSKEDPNGDDGI